MNNIPFRVIKGLEEKIIEKPVQEGCVYFATDTKKIYLDINLVIFEHFLIQLLKPLHII